jgi:hypothetical protein
VFTLFLIFFQSSLVAADVNTSKNTQMKISTHDEYQFFERKAADARSQRLLVAGIIFGLGISAGVLAGLYLSKGGSAKNSTSQIVVAPAIAGISIGIWQWIDSWPAEERFERFKREQNNPQQSSSGIYLFLKFPEKLNVAGGLSWKF